MDNVTVKVYPAGVSGLSRERAQQLKARARPEAQSGIVRKHFPCPQCGAAISLRYHRAGYVCDTCADRAEGKLPQI